MATERVNCLICGKPLAYFEEAQEVVCALCGRRETARAACTAGHYVCDECHRARGVDFIIERCLASDSRNPVDIAVAIMRGRSICQNGPEHHMLAGAALMTAYRNAGGRINLNEGLVELKDRSRQVPGGACGYWGVCGAAASAGQFWSIVSGSTPLARVPWGECQRLTSRILGRLADIGGPRCCKRSVLCAVLEGAAFVEETHRIETELPSRVVCPFFSRNAECLRQDCPFYPRER